jgi:thermitase
MFDSVQDAWNAGLVIVAAAGNSGMTTPFYPAAFPHVLSGRGFR